MKIEYIRYVLNCPMWRGTKAVSDEMCKHCPHFSKSGGDIKECDYNTLMEM
jgi:hypothetical protein